MFREPSGALSLAKRVLSVTMNEDYDEEDLPEDKYFRFLNYFVSVFYYCGVFRPYGSKGTLLGCGSWISCTDSDYFAS